MGRSSLSLVRENRETPAQAQPFNGQVWRHWRRPASQQPERLSSEPRETRRRNGEMQRFRNRRRTVQIPVVGTGSRAEQIPGGTRWIVSSTTYAYDRTTGAYATISATPARPMHHHRTPTAGCSSGRSMPIARLIRHSSTVRSKHQRSPAMGHPPRLHCIRLAVRGLLILLCVFAVPKLASSETDTLTDPRYRLGASGPRSFIRASAIRDSTSLRLFPENKDCAMAKLDIWLQRGMVTIRPRCLTAV